MFTVMKNESVVPELSVDAAPAAAIPPIDAAAPAATETATFALG